MSLQVVVQQNKNKLVEEKLEIFTWKWNLYFTFTLLVFMGAYASWHLPPWVVDSEKVQFLIFSWGVLDLLNSVAIHVCLNWFPHRNIQSKHSHLLDTKQPKLTKSGTPECEREIKGIGSIFLKKILFAKDSIFFPTITSRFMPRVIGIITH